MHEDGIPVVAAKIIRSDGSVEDLSDRVMADCDGGVYFGDVHVNSGETLEFTTHVVLR